MQNDTSSWVTEPYTFKAEKTKDWRSMLQALNQMKIYKFDMTVKFQQRYQKDKFDEQLTLQMDLETDENDKSVIVKQNKKTIRKIYASKKPKDHPHEKNMFFSKNYLKAKIFFEVYKKEIEMLENEYDIFLFCNSGGKITIFLRENQEPSKNFLTKLNNYQDKLVIFRQKQYSVYLKINYSGKLKKEIEKKGVFSRIVWDKRKPNVIFYSTELKKESQIKNIYKPILRNEISLILLNNLSVSFQQNTNNFEVVAQHLQKTKQMIEKDLKIQVEFNYLNNSIVFHNQHSVFADQPLSIMRQKLESLCIFSVRSSNKREFDNQIRRNFKKYGNFLSFKPNHNSKQTYICIDKHKIDKNKTYTLQFFNIFCKLICSINFEIIIFFTNYLDHTSVQNRIIDIAENCNLVCNQWKSKRDEKENGRKIIIRVKDFSQATKQKRQKQVLNFLNEYLLVNKLQLNAQKLIQNINKDQSIISFTDKSRSYTFDKPVTNIYEQKPNFDWLNKIHLQSPKSIHFEEDEKEKVYVKDERDKEMEKYFNEATVNIFKIWKIRVSDDIILPTNVEKNVCLVKNAFDGKKLNEKYLISGINSFENRQPGFIVYLSKQLILDFIPTHIFEKIA